MAAAVKRPWSRARRAAALLAAAAALGVTGVTATAPLWLSGPRLGRLIERELPRTRGRIHVGGGHFTWGSVWALLRGRAAWLSLDDVSITDPDGAVVFRARHVSGALAHTHAPDELLVQGLRIEDGTWRMVRTADGQGIGFLRALEAAGPPAPSPSTGTGTGLRGIRCRDAVLAGLDVDFDLPGWALTLRRVYGRGALAFQRRDDGQGLFTFAVTDADVRAGGRIAVLDGSWRTTLPFSSARIARIATTEEAPDAISIDASRIVTGRSTSALRGAFTGIFDAPGPPRPAGLRLAVTMANAADALEAVAAVRGWTPRLSIGGAAAAVSMSFSGPLAAPRLDVRARGIDVRWDDLPARAFGFHLIAELAAQRLELQDLTLTSPAGGRLSLDARLDGRRADGELRLARFDTAPYLPAALRKIAAGTLDGHLRAHLDLAARAAVLDGVALTVDRPPASPGPAVIHLWTAGEPRPPRAPGELLLRLGATELDRGTLDLPRVTAALAGGRVTAMGFVRLWDPARHDWFPSPAFDLTLDASRIALEQLLGSAVATGTISLRARAHGTFDAITLEARAPPRQRVRTLGDTFTFPATLALSLADGALTLAPLTLTAADGATLDARGSITLAGRLALRAGATGLSLRSLVAWASGVAAADVPIDGRVTTQVSVAGQASAPDVTGTVTLAETRFRGRPLGGGTLAVVTGRRGELRVRGPAAEGVTLDGTIEQTRAGARAAATLTLSHVRLDPFLAPLEEALPAPAALTGEASGVFTARAASGARPAFDARLTALAVAAHPAARAPEAPPPAALTAEAPGPVHLATDPLTGALRLEPARFTGSLGDLVLSGSVRGAAITAHARGRVNAGALVPFLPPPLEALNGALDVDLEASRREGRPAAAAGAVTIAVPVTARIQGLPFVVRATTGRGRLTGGGATIDGLTLDLGGGVLTAAGRVARARDGTLRPTLALRGLLDARMVEPLARGYLRDVAGRARVTAHLDGALALAALRAHLELAGVAFTLMPGANRVRIAGGALGLAGDTISLAHLDLRIGDGNRVLVGGQAGGPGRLRLSPGGLAATEVDLPAQGNVSALATPVAIIDAATFGVRLTGTPARGMRLAGEVVIQAAHVPPSLRHPKAPAPAPPGDRARAVLNATHLDLRVRSRSGALTIVVDHLPDLHGTLDYHLGGTVGAPKVTGALKPAGIYSAIAFFLGHLL